MPNERFIYDFFVSYAFADSAWVEGYLLDALTAAGLRCWTLSDAPPGTPYLLACEQAVVRSRYTLLVLTPSYLAEVGTQIIETLAHSHGAESRSWPVIPLILQETELPVRLRMLIPLDATEQSGWPHAIGRLCRLIDAPAPAEAAKRPCPYPGMAPFKDSDRPYYFGRSAEIAECLARLRLHPFLALIGSSGSGKSSLLAAGLVPALREAAVAAREALTIWTIRPGTTPIASFDETVRLESAGTSQLLIVDQFEEIFSAPRAQALQCMHRLQVLISSKTCSVVIAMRADFYPDLMASPLWSEVRQHRVELTPLDADGLRQAITGPARRLAVQFDQELVERLIVEAADEPGSLPLVQETLVVLWERLDRKFLPLRAYLDLTTVGTGESDIRGSVVKLAISRRADAAMAALSQSEQVIAQRIFLRLIQFGEGRANTRRQQLVSELRVHEESVALFEQTLAHLGRHRLLTLSGDETAAERKVDLAHEALIVGWPRLHRWIAELQQGEQERRSLEQRATQWVDAGGTADALLTSAEQDRAEKFLCSRAAQILGYSTRLSELTVASRRHLNALGRERRSRELQERILLGIVSAFIPGLGHIVTRRWFAGIAWMAVCTTLYIVASGSPSLLDAYWIRAQILPAALIHCSCIWDGCRLPRSRTAIVGSACTSLIIALLISNLWRSEFIASSQGPQRVWYSLPESEDGFRDGQFEGVISGAKPVAWFVPTAAIEAGYTASLRADGAKSGRYCAVIDGRHEQGVGQFGNLMQKFPARPYLMKRIRFKVSVRTELPSPSSLWSRLRSRLFIPQNRAQLWLRIDRKDERVAFFDNMGLRPITSPEWRDYEISTVVSSAAETIYVGAILFGRGKVYLDDARLEVLADPADVPPK